MPPLLAERVPLDTADALARVERLHRAARSADGHESLGDFVWRDLATPSERSAGFAAAVDGRDLAYAHVAPGDTARTGRFLVSVAVHPDARHDPEPARTVLASALAWISEHGGGHTVLWLHGPAERDDVAARDAGFRPARELVEMRARLPLDASPRWPPGITVRDFRPGADDAAWLAVNNRAFAGHPEQGAWELATLRRRMDEPWFDPTLLLLAFDGVGLAGSIWMKLHTDRTDHAGDGAVVGEIFVIGVDPRAQHLGLGRPLAVEGLRRTAERGAAEGMLFVASDNARAVSLYRSLGFREQRVDRAYERDVP
jgi:mycothiol synthase